MRFNFRIRGDTEKKYGMATAVIRDITFLPGIIGIATGHGFSPSIFTSAHEYDYDAVVLEFAPVLIATEDIDKTCLEFLEDVIYKELQDCPYASYEAPK